MDRVLETEIMKKILTNNIEKKNVMKKQIVLLERFIILKTIELSSRIDKESLEEVMHLMITEPMSNMLSVSMDEYETMELQYYAKAMETVELILLSGADKTRQLIYLENVMKKANNRANDFSEQLKDSDSEKTKETEEKIDHLFGRLIEKIKNNYRLSLDEVDDLSEIVDKYKDNFVSDLKSDLNSMNIYDMKAIEEIIEREIYCNDLRKGKTKQQFQYEKSLIEQANRTANKLLDNSIRKNKERFMGQLDQSSTDLVNLIFEALPKEYESQRLLLEVILDTDIKERLTSLANEEIETEKSILSSKNENILENELYDEKRYKKFPTYEFEPECIDEVYKNILKEVRNAYLLPDDDMLAKKLDFKIRTESTKTKNSFTSMISNIKRDNQNNVTAIVEDLTNIRETNSRMDGRKGITPKK